MGSGTAVAVAAVDIGASGGRVVLATVSPDSLDLREVHRFPNGGVRVGGELQWDVLALYGGVLEGLRLAGREVPRLDGVGVDTWAVDYGLLDGDGRLLGNPVHHRDGRTDGTAARVAAMVDPAGRYARTGIRDLPFNTVNQLVAEQGSVRLAAARTLLLVPDLMAYWLTGGPAGGAVGAEITNASTTQLLDARTRTWDTELVRSLGLDPSLLPPLREPGQTLGRLSPDVLDQTGLRGPVPVVAVGSHDTASAVVGTPGRGRFAYVSSGTWSLVGTELTAPVLTEDSRSAGFTNEAGVDGTIRYLRNVTGLWPLQESLRTWARRGVPVALDGLLAEASRLPAGRWLVDVDSPSLLPPGDMPGRLAALCRESGGPVPDSPAEVVRCVIDSLAAAHARAVHEMAALTGREVTALHLVGGGARNALLCRATADAAGLPVLAGPAEASALGNALVQARALGVDLPDLDAMRALVRRCAPPRRYPPRPRQPG
ncbi:MAG: rhamnulokinase family protein [Kineosporiaceae bacterium]